jgi:D-alanyl-lipoteichoic acid acyltransferase DltB (MBOAT superfamily)
MQFNTIHFAFFFITVYLLYVILNHRWQNRLLLLASYAFYCFWDWRFLPLLWLSTIVNFYCGLKIDNLPEGRGRRNWLVVAICFNLGVLGFFKYFNFFSEGLRTMLWLVGFQPNPMTLNIILPLGISFYTFQVMSYPIDIYWNRIKSTKRFLDFSVFVAFFPLIISGPIERARNMLPQLIQRRDITAEKLYAGSWLIFWGLYKKLVIADNLARITTGVFSPYAGGLPGGLTFFAIIVFTLQLYADFSGYSDIARGLSKVMGFDIMLNFRTPFFSKNPADLWQRWHISLTTWIKEYLYYPLGLARFFGRELNAYLVILLTWSIMGFWHGPEFKYILWGVYHGALIIIYSKLKQFAGFLKVGNRFAAGISSAVRMLIMFTLFSAGLIFFAVNSSREAFSAIHDMIFNLSRAFSFGQFRSFYIGMMAIFLLPMAVIEYFQYRADDELVIFRWPAPLRAIIYYLLFYLIIIYGVFSVQKFYYFQF